MRIPVDRAERITDFMSDAGGETPEARHFLDAHDALLLGDELVGHGVDRPR
jgi:hypothetical protein